MVRNGFFIGKRILSAFHRYARLASHEQAAAKKDSYAFADRAETVEECALNRLAVVGLWRMAYSACFVRSNHKL
jgi:hypothetical protein